MVEKSVLVSGIVFFRDFFRHWPLFIKFTERSAFGQCLTKTAWLAVLNIFSFILFCWDCSDKCWQS